MTDVMAAGHHVAVMAVVHPGDTAIVMGDGAVGLCGTLAARRLGAERIVVLGHQPFRLELARMFGATDVVTTRGKRPSARCSNSPKEEDMRSWNVLEAKKRSI